MGEPTDVALAYFSALSSGDVDGAVRLLADDADFPSPIGEISGRDAIRAFLGGFETAFPGAQYNVDHVIEAGTLVAVEGVYSGIHSGPLSTPDGGSLPPTGRSVTAPFATIFHVAGGRITSHRPYWDRAGFMGQLTG